MFIPLSTIIEQGTREEVNISLSNFSCIQDNDIERFLKEKSVLFEELSKSRTYLICDEEELVKGDLKSLTIYGFFTLALKVYKASDDLSNRARKEMDGLSAKIHGERISHFSCFLIGQLSRNSNVDKDTVSGKQIIDTADRLIKSAQDIVGGRYLLVECKEEEKLIHFYKNNGFKVISSISDGNTKMIQMIRKI